MMRPDERTLTAAKDIRARAAEWLVEARSSDHWDTEAQAKLRAWLAEFSIPRRRISPARGRLEPHGPSRSIAFATSPLI